MLLSEKAFYCVVSFVCDLEIRVLKKFCNVFGFFSSVCKSSPFLWCSCVIYIVSLLCVRYGILFGDNAV
jgi:hypothetical protein